MNSECGAILKALSEPQRLRIVGALAVEARSVKDLMALLNMEQSNVSKGLKILRAAGIVQFTQAGIVRTYRITDGVLVVGEEKHVLEFGCCRFRLDRISELTVTPSK